MTDKKPTEKEESEPRRPVPEDGMGERIKEAREKSEWTQAILSNRTKLLDPNKEGISRTVLVGYESGKYKPGARELRLLADTLHVTPNWLLYGTEKPFRISLPSVEFLQGNDDMDKALRIALALCILKPHERELIGSMMLSLAGRELGDLQLSGLMTMARLFGQEIVERMKAEFGTSSVEEAVRKMSDGAWSNWGTGLTFNDSGEITNGEPIYKEPPKGK